MYDLLGKGIFSADGHVSLFALLKIDLYEAVRMCLRACHI